MLSFFGNLHSYAEDSPCVYMVRSPYSLARERILGELILSGRGAYSNSNC